MRINLSYKYKFTTIFGIGLNILFLSIGIVMFNIQNIKPVFYSEGNYIARLSETPVEKENSYKALLNIYGVENNETVLETNENVIVYFSKCDKVSELKAGSVVIFDISPQEIRNSGNPYEFNYKGYFERMKIYRQVYLREANWRLTTIKPAFSVYIEAELLRDKLLSIYRSQTLGDTEYKILSALTLGYKRNLDPEVKQVFSSAGASHILAVSGLHVGIVFWVISLVFGFLKKQRKGKFIFVTICIISIWFYAILTGLSPSVQRAAIMVTVFVVGDNLKRGMNIYNTLAASALLILFMNPLNLFDIGFQLSYSAVLGIVFLHPKFNRLLAFENKLMKYLWDILTVSVAAQISTLPLTIFYFNQFPVYFWLTNLYIIPVVQLLIPLGIFLFFVAKVPVISVIISFLLHKIIHFTFLFLQYIESLPFAVSEINLSTTGFIFVLISLFFLFVFIESKRTHFLQFSILFLTAFAGTSCINKYNRLNEKIFIVYNYPENTMIHLISGRRNYIISEKYLDSSSFEYRIILNTRRKLGLNKAVILEKNSSFADEFLYLENGLISFSGINIGFDEKLRNMEKNRLIYEVTSRDFDVEYKNGNGLVQITSKLKNFNNIMEPADIHQLQLKGAYVLRW